MRPAKRTLSEAASFHAEEHSILRTGALMSVAAILILGVVSAVMSLAHLA
jgi:hypothetical protein